MDTSDILLQIGIINQTVLETLKSKHPAAHSVDQACVLESSDIKVQPVIFEEIDSEMIYNLAKNVSGSGGPSKVDSEMWKHMLCSKAFGKISVRLCQSVANTAKRLCQEEVPSSFLTELVSCRLIPLIKDNTGVRPIGIGEVIRRLIAKAVVRVLKHDIQYAAGPLQTCAGLEGGIEATAHAMSKAYHQQTSEGLILVDADNAFNSMNRKTALLNIKALCPPFYTYLNNTYKTPSKLYVDNSNEIILSEEGTTQGDPDAMPMYAIASRPIIDKLDETCNTEITKQCWYADDSAAASTLEELKKWWDTLCDVGPMYGYFPKPSKTVLIVKEEFAEKARLMFKDTGVKITTEGMRHASLGSCGWNRAISETVC